LELACQALSQPGPDRAKFRIKNEFIYHSSLSQRQTGVVDGG
jgi:hypothetical protein